VGMHLATVMMAGLDYLCPALHVTPVNAVAN
jgi:hypothetical protein